MATLTLFWRQKEMRDGAPLMRGDAERPTFFLLSPNADQSHSFLLPSFLPSFLTPVIALGALQMLPLQVAVPGVGRGKRGVAELAVKRL